MPDREKLHIRSKHFADCGTHRLAVRMTSGEVMVDGLDQLFSRALSFFVHYDGTTRSMLLDSCADIAELQESLEMATGLLETSRALRFSVASVMSLHQHQTCRRPNSRASAQLLRQDTSFRVVVKACATREHSAPARQTPWRAANHCQHHTAAQDTKGQMVNVLERKHGNQDREPSSCHKSNRCQHNSHSLAAGITCTIQLCSLISGILRREWQATVPLSQ